MAKCGTRALELDGITSETHPLHHVEYGRDIFTEIARSKVWIFQMQQDDTISSDHIEMNKPFNCPRPLIQYYYIGDSARAVYGL